MPLRVHIINMMKIRENKMGEGGEEDWWRRNPEDFARVCNNGSYCQEQNKPSEELHDAQLYAALYDEVHDGGSLGRFFGPNIEYAAFKEICRNNPGVREECVNSYRQKKLKEIAVRN